MIQYYNFTVRMIQYYNFTILYAYFTTQRWDVGCLGAFVDVWCGALSQTYSES
jgi:hypothetical protein